MPLLITTRGRRYLDNKFGLGSNYMRYLICTDDNIQIIQGTFELVSSGRQATSGGRRVADGGRCVCGDDTRAQEDPLPTLL